MVLVRRLATNAMAIAMLEKSANKLQENYNTMNAYNYEGPSIQIAS